jgi:hypothetical protein
MVYGATPAGNSRGARAIYPHKINAPHVGAFFLYGTAVINLKKEMIDSSLGQ